MSVVRRPEGNEFAKLYGKYINDNGTQRIRIRPESELDVLCSDGLNYVVTVKSYDSQTDHGHLHFNFWSKACDYIGPFDVLYLAKKGTYTKGISSKNTWTRRFSKTEETVKKPNTARQSRFSSGVVHEASGLCHTRYADDFLAKPRWKPSASSATSEQKAVVVCEHNRIAGKCTTCNPSLVPPFAETTTAWSASEAPLVIKFKKIPANKGNTSFPTTVATGNPAKKRTKKRLSFDENLDDECVHGLLFGQCHFCSRGIIISGGSTKMKRRPKEVTTKRKKSSADETDGDRAHADNESGATAVKYKRLKVKTLTLPMPVSSAHDTVTTTEDKGEGESEGASSGGEEGIERSNKTVSFNNSALLRSIKIPAHRLLLSAVVPLARSTAQPPQQSRMPQTDQTLKPLPLTSPLDYHVPTAVDGSSPPDSLASLDSQDSDTEPAIDTGASTVPTQTGSGRIRHSAKSRSTAIPRKTSGLEEDDYENVVLWTGSDEPADFVPTVDSLDSYAAHTATATNSAIDVNNHNGAHAKAHNMLASSSSSNSSYQQSSSSSSSNVHWTTLGTPASVTGLISCNGRFTGTIEYVRHLLNIPASIQNTDAALRAVAETSTELLMAPVTATELGRIPVGSGCHPESIARLQRLQELLQARKCIENIMRDMLL